MVKAKKKSIIWSVIKSILMILLIFIGTVAYLNRQYIIDKVVVARFVPSSGVIALADKSGMNSYGKFLYLASQPSLDAADRFNQNCQKTETTTSILGCYNNGRIYIFNVTDPQLSGVSEVTATHEMLHAAYDRLTQYDKDKINILLDSEYIKLISDKSFAEKMAFYDRTEAGQRDNELHSVIGTEIALISPELETYYSKYFSNRQAVVGLNAEYIGVFKSLEDKATDLKNQMDNLIISINTRSDQYKESVQSLNEDITAFNNSANDDQFLTQAQFDYQRSLLSDRISAINSNQQDINADIGQYNLIMAEYNSIATRSKDLYKSIDSTLAPAPLI